MQGQRPANVLWPVDQCWGEGNDVSASRTLRPTACSGFARLAPIQESQNPGEATGMPSMSASRAARAGSAIDTRGIGESPGARLVCDHEPTDWLFTLERDP